MGGRAGGLQFIDSSDCLLIMNRNTTEQEDFSHQLSALADQAIAFLSLCEGGKCTA